MQLSLDALYGGIQISVGICNVRQEILSFFDLVTAFISYLPSAGALTRAVIGFGGQYVIYIVLISYTVPSDTIFSIDTCWNGYCNIIFPHSDSSDFSQCQVCT